MARCCAASARSCTSVSPMHWRKSGRRSLRHSLNSLRNIARMAGLAEQAAAYYTRAGQRAVARSAMAEATAHLTKGLELLTSLPDSASRQRQELELQLALGRVLIATQGYAAPAVGETFERARALCEQLDRPPQIVPVLYGQWAFHLLKGPLHVARELAAEMLRRGEDTSDAAVILMGHRLSGSTCFQLGEFSAARAHLEKGLAQFDPKDRPFYMSLAAQDAKVTMLAYLSANLIYLGYLDQARLGSKAAVEEARKLGHAFNLAHALHLSCLADFATLSLANVCRRGRTLIIALSEEHGFPSFAPLRPSGEDGHWPRSVKPRRGSPRSKTGLAQYRRDRSGSVCSLCPYRARRCGGESEAAGPGTRPSP